MRAMRSMPAPGSWSAGTSIHGIGRLLLGLAVLAALLRGLTYTGFFGSDEVTYLIAAVRVLDGDWTLDDYVGANRVGVNLPMAASMALLGRNELAAALYSALCSVAEVLLVAWAGWRLFGPRVGLIAGLLLATLPAHLHFGGRMMADAPLALAISAAFVLFAEGELRRWSTGFFLAGVFAGLSFLVKPVTVFVFGILLAYPFATRRWDTRWLWMAVGFAFAMAANGLLYLALTGRFWYVFEVMRERRQSGYLEAGAAAGQILASPTLYLEYLFVRIYHTGLIGWLAVAGLWLCWRRRQSLDPGSRTAAAYVVFWALGLLAILSLLPVSLRPLAWIPKQTNYMLIFVAPLALLAALPLATLTPRRLMAAMVVIGAVGLGFGLLHQAKIRTFTANSAATLDHVRTLPGTDVVHVMSNAYRAAQFERALGRDDVLARLQPSSALRRADRSQTRWLVVDAETLEWDDSAPLPRADAVPACWQAERRIQGRPQGLGTRLVQSLGAGVAPIPGGGALAARLRALSEPQPAVLYRLPPGC
jgi:4-amino-4-deoxy-L-arabinose transferase-like glycosyltransferase